MFPQLTGVRHKGSQCITEKLLLVKFHFFGVHFDGPWANGEGAPPLPVLDEARVEVLHAMGRGGWLHAAQPVLDPSKSNI